MKIFFLLLCLISTSFAASPAIVSEVTVINSHTLALTFSESVSSTALKPKNYLIFGEGRGSLSPHPERVVFQSKHTYHLIWPMNEMKQGGALLVKAVWLDSSAAVSGGGIGESPKISNVRVKSDSVVDITFNEYLETRSALDEHSYVIQGAGHPDEVEKIAMDTYRLTFLKGEMAKAQELTIETHVKDLAGNSGSDTMTTPIVK